MAFTHTLRRRLARATGLALTLAAVPQVAQAAPLDPVAARAAIDAQLAKIYPSLDALYKDLHQHPEVGFQETRTAALLAARMRQLGFTVTEHVGQTGIVAVYRNGDGPVVLVRTELDALPLEEKTGLPYASHAQQTIDGKLTPTDHACGHDSHMAWWVGTAQTLLALKDKWHGTLVFIGQPAEEKAGGAKAMLADGLFTRFPKPDYAFAAHVGPDVAGHVTVKQGAVSSASDSVVVTFHGQGAHGSMPDKSIDPIVMGAHFVDDVQTVISRQKDPQKFGVITVGAFNAGFVPNIIPDTAVLKLTLRSYDPDVRKLLLDGVGITARAVASMARAPEPGVDHTEATASVVNDPALAGQLAGILKTALGDAQVALVPAMMPGGTASEDYSEYVNAGVAKSVFFGVGGSDPAMLARLKAEGKPVPVNHSPFFAPQPEPTIRAGVETLALAVLGVAGN
ncbi:MULTISPECIES: amidohydrolase [unclassified Novosphingobium]|uniref:amidohydrolase n=1 Tax=unclassified Novosphingobium TaxID=2644732 RepID=UPI001493F100|nr:MULTISPECIES: amidohydrolase [unclassified Novosphingobium]MBB3358156.1 hippurate hydrolase [Novosphingobium sp. BK256]MBB3374517.1 hippurate hydrolase [Novosphingobium sp. BK280]MBB3378929.1 hippurate hydrolase [Novosphingobium sp. BK258]MBB3420623.1 hippurate hydrolase [Novosphingobium sp. BK267]MBB3448255.1 hippurate hydrolase [Novosphingobium sp. BK352]